MESNDFSMLFFDKFLCFDAIDEYHEREWYIATVYVEEKKVLLKTEEKR